MDRLKSILRDRRIWLCVGCLAVMALIALAYFPDAMQGRVLRQGDMVQGMSNNHEARLWQEKTGELPRWTNALFSGMPTFQITPEYPSDNLFGWINTVMGLGLPSPANLLVMMMVGMFILLLAMRMRWWVALIGAIGYGFSSYFMIIIGAGHIWKYLTLTYIPPTIAGIVLAYRGRLLWGSALAALFTMMQISANHVQMTYYFLFVVLGFMVAYLLDAFKRKEIRRWAVATLCLAGAAVLGVLANAPSLYNTYEYSKETMRGGHSDLTSEQKSGNGNGLDLEYITQYSYEPSETMTLLIPNIKGGGNVKPGDGGLQAMTLADDAAKTADLGEAEGLYLQWVSPYFGGPEGTNGPVYVGAVIVALFLLGCIICKGTLKWILLALTIVSIFLAWGRYMMWFTEAWVNWVPMYNKFRTVESILVIAEFTMPLVAVMALQKVASTPKTDRMQLVKPTLWAFGVPAVLCLLPIIAPGIYGSLITDNDRAQDSQISEALAQQGADAQTIEMLSLRNVGVYEAIEDARAGLVRGDAARSLVLVLLAGGMLLLWEQKRINDAVAGLGMVLLVLVDLVTVNQRYLNSENFSEPVTGDYVPMTAADKAILADTTSHYRVADLDRFMSPEASYYHKSIGGYHAAKLARYNDLINHQILPALQGQGNPEVLNMLNTKYLIMDGRVVPNPDAYGNAWFVSKINYVATPDEEMAALSTINPRDEAVANKKIAKALGTANPVAPGDTIYLTSYAPDRLQYRSRSANGGVAVFSEVWFPWGWKATVDGKEAEIYPVDYVLRAMRLPAGDHRIDMVFKPKSIQVSNTIATASILLIYLLFVGALTYMAIGGKRKGAAGVKDAD